MSAKLFHGTITKVSLDVKTGENRASVLVTITTVIPYRTVVSQNRDKYILKYLIIS